MSIGSAELIAAFRMPPELAVAYLRSKGLKVSGNWREVWQAAHARAFTVAQSAGYDVLGDIRDSLETAMNEGQSYNQFIDSLEPTLRKKGWWGVKTDLSTGEIELHKGMDRPVELGTPRRLQLIYEQNIQTAFMAGRYRTMKEAVVTHPYWEYVAVMDERTRPEHARLNGMLFRHDDPIWSVIYPPNGFRCRCRVRPASIASVERRGLTVHSSDGYITEYQYQRRDGSVVPVKQIQLPNMDKPFRPDVGFDYNPAEEYYRGAA